MVSVPLMGGTIVIDAHASQGVSFLLEESEDARLAGGSVVIERILPSGLLAGQNRAASAAEFQARVSPLACRNTCSSSSGIAVPAYPQVKQTVTGEFSTTGTVFLAASV